MRISSLRLFLQRLCYSSPWNYAAFWKLKYQPEINDDQKTIHSNSSEACDILIADQKVPAFMVQDLCNPFIAGLVNSCGNLIDRDRNLRSLGRLKCDDIEVSESVIFKPRLNEKARAIPLSDNFQRMKHGEFVNELGDFYFEEGPIEPNSICNNFVYDCETGGTLLSLPSEYELQNAFGSAVVGYSDRIHDGPYLRSQCTLGLNQ